MAIWATESESGRWISIFIEGRFDFSLHAEFRSAYERRASLPERYELDFEETTYVDSSALGMLLILKEYASRQQASVVLRNCSKEVKKILNVANFGQIFDIE